MRNLLHIYYIHLYHRLYNKFKHWNKEWQNTICFNISLLQCTHNLLNINFLTYRVYYVYVQIEYSMVCGLTLFLYSTRCVFCIPSFGEGTDSKHRVGKTSYPTINHRRFFLSHATTHSPSLLNFYSSHLDAKFRMSFLNQKINIIYIDAIPVVFEKKIMPWVISTAYMYESAMW